MKAPFLSILLLSALLGGFSPSLSAQTDGTPPPGKDLPPGGDRPEEEDLPAVGDPDGIQSLQGPQSFSLQVFTDPDPLPQGSRGHIYVLMLLGKDRFLTRGPRETFLKPPRKAGPLKLGSPEWPPPSGNFRHPETGRTIPGWTGQVFVKIPVQIPAGAPLGPVSLKIDFQYRVLSTHPKAAGMVNVDPLQVQARIGPPLPRVVFSEKPAASSGGSGSRPGPAGGKKPSGGTSEKEPPRKSGGPEGPAGEAVPGKGPDRGGPAAPDDLEDLPPAPAAGGWLDNPALVFGAAGLLILGALLILFRGKKS